MKKRAKTKANEPVVVRSLDSIVRHAEIPIVGRWFRHGRRWWMPMHKVVRIKECRVYSEGECGNTGTCYPLWLWKRKYYSLSNHCVLPPAAPAGREQRVVGHSESKGGEH